MAERTVLFRLHDEPWKLPEDPLDVKGIAKSSQEEEVDVIEIGDSIITYAELEKKIKTAKGLGEDEKWVLHRRASKFNILQWVLIVDKEEVLRFADNTTVLILQGKKAEHGDEMLAAKRGAKRAGVGDALEQGETKKLKSLVAGMPTFTDQQLLDRNLTRKHEEYVAGLLEKGKLSMSSMKQLHRRIAGKAASVEQVKAFEMLAAGGEEYEDAVVQALSALDGVNVSLFGPATTLHRKVLEYYAPETGLTVGTLSSPVAFQDVPLPTLSPSEDSPTPTYTYVGRKMFEELYNAVTSPEYMTVEFMGPPGTGKSHVVATLAGFCHARLRQGHLIRQAPTGDGGEVWMNQRVVYLLGSRFASDPRNHLHGALLIGFAGDITSTSELLALTTLKGLVDWCISFLANGRIMWFIDEFNELDQVKHSNLAVGPLDRDAARGALLKVIAGHVVVISASIRSERVTQRIRKGTRQGLKLIEFATPFSAEELAMFLFGKIGEEMKLPLDMLQFYTGSFPRLVFLYTTSPTLVHFKNSMIFHAAMIDDYFKTMTSLQADVIQKFLAGAKVTVQDYVQVEKTTFYVDNNMRGRCLSGWLQEYTLEKLVCWASQVKTDEETLKSHIWQAAICEDMKYPSQNAARIGWNTESLSTCIISTKGIPGWTVDKAQWYDHGQEQEAWWSLPEEVRKKCVLFIPKAFNEEHIDLVLRRWDSVNKEWNVAGVQITVGSWEAKRLKDSHTLWANAAKCGVWVPEGAQFTPTYYYIMRACEKQPFSEAVKSRTIELKTGPKEVVRQCVVNWLSFKELDKRLEFIDDWAHKTEQLPISTRTMLSTVGLCGAQTKSGETCRNPALAGSKCWRHKATVQQIVAVQIDEVVQSDLA